MRDSQPKTKTPYFGLSNSLNVSGDASRELVRRCCTVRIREYVAATAGLTGAAFLLTQRFLHTRSRKCLLGPGAGLALGPLRRHAGHREALQSAAPQRTAGAALCRSPRDRGHCAQGAAHRPADSARSVLRTRNGHARCRPSYGCARPVWALLSSPGEPSSVPGAHMAVIPCKGEMVELGCHLCKGLRSGPRFMDFLGRNKVGPIRFTQE